MEKQSSVVQIITWNLLDSMRGYVQNNREEVALKLIMLFILSQKNQLPDDLKLNKELAENKEKWLELIEALKSSENKQVQRVFLNSHNLEELPLPFLHSAINTLLKYHSETLQDPAIDAIRLLTSNYSAVKEPFPDFSVSLLANRILDRKDSESLYVMSPASLSVCAIASNDADGVYYETVNQSGMVADTISVMSKNGFEVRYSDPLQSPSYTVSDNELKQFDYGISFSMMGIKLPKHTIDNLDAYDRFTITTKKIETANILHMIKQCKKRFVVSISEGVLYSTMDKELRQYLVDNGMLKAVISLPSGIWTGTGVKTSLLVIEPKGNNKTVRFVDATDEEFISKSTSRLISLDNLDKILDYLNSDEESDCAISPPLNNVKINDYNLDVSRYVLDPEQKRVKRQLKNFETASLDSLVRFERGLPFKYDEGDYTVLEVGAEELNSIGDIEEPSKEVQISETVRAQNESGFLKPNDIVLMLKGSAGKLGLVPENVPTEGDRRWMINRSGIVLRTVSEKIDPKSLYAYLCSEMGQVQLDELVKGSSISNISLKELKTLPIILPTKAEQQQAANIVDKSRETQKAIQQLLVEHEQRRRELWGL